MQRRKSRVNDWPDIDRLGYAVDVAALMSGASEAMATRGRNAILKSQSALTDSYLVEGERERERPVSHRKTVRNWELLLREKCSRVEKELCESFQHLSSTSVYLAIQPCIPGYTPLYTWQYSPVYPPVCSPVYLPEYRA